MNAFNGNTRVFCFVCGEEHQAVTYEEDGSMKCRIDCPRSPGKVIALSSDAAQFLRFRSFPAQKVERRQQFALLHVTDRCSMRCPICYASSGDGGARPVDEIVEMARRAKEAGVRSVSLTGGEPTEHPGLEEIVRRVSRDLGLRTALLTNGLALAADGSLAGRLRRAGLSKAVISFDTLSSDTSRAMRGGDYVAAKLRAFSSAAAAGLSLSANTTVCDLNLHEVGAVFRTLASRFPRMTHVLLQPFADFGRRDVHCRIDREQIVRALVESGEFPVSDPDHFIPVPNIPAFGVSVHPDCCAVCPVVVRGVGPNARMAPLSSPDALRRLCVRLASVDGRGIIPPTMKAAFAWFRCAGLLGLPLLGRRGIGGRVVLAVIDNLPDRDCMLADRIGRCGSALVCADGCLRPVCAAYRMGLERRK